jgi:DUF1009 family protein
MGISPENNSSEKEILGVVAGSGQLPLHLATEAKKLGLSVYGVCHVNETSPEFSGLCQDTIAVRIGQLGKIIAYFKSKGVKKVIFAGGISRPNLLKGNVWPDARGLSVLLRIGSVKDDVILRGIATEFEKDGLAVVSVSEILKNFVPKAGILTKRALSTDEQKDAAVGWEAAKIIGQADVGQTVVVSQGMVVAVEAVEGTDNAIKRGGDLSAGRGGLVVKTCKPQQDERLDLPTIGVQTIKTIKSSGLTALIVEAGRSLILEPAEVISEADRSGIAIEAR